MKAKTSPIISQTVSILSSVSHWLSTYASAFIIATAILTFFIPELFEWVRGTTQTIILGIIMLTMGLTLTTRDFHILARRPLDIMIGACAQFIIMPCVAYLLVHVFRLEPALALGILLVGCCPGGVSSNIMSYLCHGDVAFSVGMTCASTLLAPFMTPLLMQLTAGEIIAIDAIGMFLNIFIVTIIPVGIGCFLNYTYSRQPQFPTVQSLMPGVSVICLACIVGGVISTVHDILLARGLVLFIWNFSVVLCHNSLGYLLGWMAGRLAQFNTAKKKTLSIEVGMQNAGLATVLAGTFFAAQPLAVLPCAISCAWHSISGTILAGLFLRWDKSHRQEPSITIQPATKEQSAEIAHLIMTAMTDECCLNFCGEGCGLEDFRHMLTLLIERTDSQYSYQNTIVAVETERADTHQQHVIGIATSYDGKLLHELRHAFITMAKIHLNRDHSGMDDETQAGELYLDSLAVLPQYRHQGIAHRLLEATAERARQLGLPCIGLLVDHSNSVGERLYLNVGFRYVNDSHWGGHPMKHLVWYL